MYRIAIEELKKWKKSRTRKPLILNGARQVGKTWLLKHFGEENYKNVAYLNLEGNPLSQSIFSSTDPKTIIENIEIFLKTKIVPKETLIIIDEIQTTPAALTSLKYFCEEANDYHIAVAGSLLGIAVNQGASFPVGKVDFINIYPMNFYEFLLATENRQLAQKIKSGSPESLEPFHEMLVSLLKKYFIVGGMPEVVANFISTGNMLETRKLQNRILDSYERDFAKHVNLSEAVKIREIYQIIPNQLAKENKKFIFGLIRTGARAASYETALLWLEDAGLISRVHRIKTAKIPLKAYSENDVFKVYMSDIGLLGAKAELEPSVILENERLFVEFKGALAEQFVFSELRSIGETLYYYTNDDSRNEIDFIISFNTSILPIEIKSGQNLKSASLNSFIEDNNLKKAIKFSTLPYKKNKVIINAPLYLAEFLQSLLD